MSSPSTAAYLRSGELTRSLPATMQVLGQFRFISKASGGAATTAEQTVSPRVPLACPLPTIRPSTSGSSARSGLSRAAHAPPPHPPPRPAPRALRAPPPSTRHPSSSGRPPAPPGLPGQQPGSAAHHLQRTGQIVRPLPGVQPRLVGHRPALPQDTEHARGCPRAPQLTGRRERDPPRRIVSTGPDSPPCRRHGHQQDGPVSRPRAADPFAIAFRPLPLAPRLPSPASQPPLRSHGPPGRSRTSRRLQSGPHGPGQGRAQWCRQGQRTALLVSEQHRPHLVRIGSGRVHRRQPGRFRHRSHPARRGPAQDGTALGTEHRARPSTASALGRQHQIREVPPPPPHGHHCANARPTRPPLWTTACGQLRGRCVQGDGDGSRRDSWPFGGQPRRRRRTATGTPSDGPRTTLGPPGVPDGPTAENLPG